MAYYFKHRDYADPEFDDEGLKLHVRYYGPFDTEEEAATFNAAHSNRAGRLAYHGIEQIDEDTRIHMLQYPEESIRAKKVSFLHPSEAGYYIRSYDEWKEVFTKEGHNWLLN